VDVVGIHRQWESIKKTLRPDNAGLGGVPLKTKTVALKRFVLWWTILYCAFLVILGFFFGSYYSGLMKARTLSIVSAFPLTFDSLLKERTDQDPHRAPRSYAYWKWDEKGSLVSSSVDQTVDGPFIPPENYDKIKLLTKNANPYLSDFVRKPPQGPLYFYYALAEGETLTVFAFLAEEWLTRLKSLLPPVESGFVADRNGNGFYFDAKGIEEVNSADPATYRSMGSVMVKYLGEHYFYSSASFSNLTLTRLLPFYRTIPFLFLTAIIPFLGGLIVLWGVSHHIKRLQREQASAFRRLSQEMDRRAFGQGAAARYGPNDPVTELREKIREIVSENAEYEKEIDRLTRKSALLSESIRDSYQSVSSVNRLLQKFAFSEDYTFPRAIDLVTNVILSTDQAVEKAVVYLNDEIAFQKGTISIPENGSEEFSIEQGHNRIRVLLEPSRECSERDFSIKQEVLLTFLYTTAILFQLKRETQLDPFTGLYRFEHFSRLVQVELDKAQRYRRCCSLAMTSLRNFRIINERYGLNTSNRFLATVSKVIRENIRSGDLAGHYSGDRFLIFFQEIVKNDSRKKMEKLKELMMQALPKDVHPGQWDFEYGIADCLEGSLSFTELVTTAYNDMAAKRE